MTDIHIQMKNKVGETWNKLFPKTKMSLVEGLPEKLTEVDEGLNAAATKAEVNTKLAAVGEQLAETVDQITAIDAAKADKTEVNALATAKANQADLIATNDVVATKAATAYVDQQVAAMASGSPKGVYATAEALQAAFPSGTTGTYVVTADGNWYYWNGTAWTVGGMYQSTGIAENTITPKMTTFINEGLNKCDDSKFTNENFDVPTSTWVVDVTNNATPYITVTGSYIHTMSLSGTTFKYNARRVVWYDSNKNRLSSNSTVLTALSVPANAAYVRVVFFVTDSQFYVGFNDTGTQPVYEMFSQKVSSKYLPSLPTKTSDLTNDSGFITSIPNGSVTPEKTTFFEIVTTKSINRVDESKMISGNLNDLTGNISSHQTYKTTEFIEVSNQFAHLYARYDSGNFVLLANRLCFYDANKVFISGSSNVSTVQNIPASAVYCRATWDSLHYSQLFLAFSLSNSETFSYSVFLDTSSKKFKDEYLGGIPTKTSDLTNDSGYVTDTDLLEIPASTSQLTNDSGFITIDDVPAVSFTNKRNKSYPDVVIFGDSITNQNGDVSATGYRYFTSSGYFTWANVLSGGKMNLVANAGIAGNSTTAMLARFDADVLAHNPDMVIVFGGTNDIALGYTSATTISNLSQIYNMLKVNGITIVVCTVLPRTEFDTTSKKNALWDVNNFIKDYASTNANCILCDWYSTIVDIDGFSVRVNMTKDGTHPTILGAYRMGAKLASVLNFPSSKIISNGYDDKRNILTNGCLSGDVSGKATGWSLTSSATVTPSKVVVDDGIDYYNQQVLTCTDDTVSIDFYCDITTGFAIGDTIQGIAEFELSNMTTIKAINVRVYYLTPTQVGLGRSSQNIVTYDFTGIPTSLPGGVLKTPKLVIPADAQSLRYFITVNMNGTIKLSNLTLYNYGQ